MQTKQDDNYIETKIFTIMAPRKIMRRLERLFALFHWNSFRGRAGLFAMPLLGNEKIKIECIWNDTLQHEVDAIQSANYDVVVAYREIYSGYNFDKTTDPIEDWYTRAPGSLYHNNELVYMICEDSKK